MASVISSVFVRGVPTLAMAAATVDHLSQQRVILGLGSSHKVQVEPEYGIPYGKPIQRVRESVAIIRTLLRDGVVSYQGDTVRIARFDRWFTPTRREIPIYLSGRFLKMLEVCGDIAQGVLMTRSTLETSRQAAVHIARGAQHAGRRPQDIDIAPLSPCSVAANRQEAFDVMRPAVAFYASFFPRYNSLIAESGFADAAQAIRTAWARAVPDALIAATEVVGTPAKCRACLAAYRHVGMALPIISPFSRGANGKQRAIAAIKTCAPSYHMRRLHLHLHQALVRRHDGHQTLACGTARKAASVGYPCPGASGALWGVSGAPQ